MGNHSLNPNIANKYGPNCAFILQYIFYWTNENKKNNKETTHFHEGKWWTYSSVRELSEYFTYLTVRQIRTALEILKENELVLTANFNNCCNRTLWYTVTDKAIAIMNNQEEIQDNFSNLDEETIIEEGNNAPESSSEVQKCQNDLSPMSNGFVTSDKTICHTGQMDLPSVTNGTNNKQHNINSNIKLQEEKEIYKEKEPPDKVIFDFWNSKKLLKASELDNKLKSSIATALKSFTLDEIKLYISRYDEVLNSSFYLSHVWSLNSFLIKNNAIYDFRDTGEKWQGYVKWLSDKKQNTGFSFESLQEMYNQSLIGDVQYAIN